MLGIEELKNRIVPIISQYPVDKVSVFGSCARKQMNKNSDIDILISFSIPIGMFKFIEIKQVLEENLKHKIDLITFNSLNESDIKDAVLMEAIEIYDKRH